MISAEVQIQMYEALISSKLLYALEAIPIPDVMYDRIDSSYFKGLRQILNMTTTYGQKHKGEAMTNTNEQVLHIINEELKKGNQHKTFVLLSDRIKETAIKLLGKTIRK